jgi:hypothetical protein
MIVDPGARYRQTLGKRCGRHRFGDQSAQDAVTLRVCHDTKSFKITNRRLLTKRIQYFLNDFIISESKSVVKGIRRQPKFIRRRGARPTLHSDASICRGLR